ncbi:hypothetical protein KI387_001344, partial [Taxus chinensis]
MLKRVKLLENEMGVVPENIRDELSSSREEHILVVQKKIDEVIMPFTLDSIGRIINLHVDIEGYGPSLERVKANIVDFSRGLMWFKTEKEVVAKADGKLLSHMFD